MKDDATDARTPLRAWLGGALLALQLCACGTSNGPSTPATHKATGHDAGSAQDAGVACSTHPSTHEEIINACTDAEVVDKNPKLPLLLADGGLPPLP
ncbi:MAG: hypothetical protein ACHQ53_14565 [Polyangiales bacterium]